MSTETPRQFAQRTASAWRWPALHLSATLADLPEACGKALTPQVIKALEGKLPASYGLIAPDAPKAISAVTLLALEGLATRRPEVMADTSLRHQGLWLDWAALAPRAAIAPYHSDPVDRLNTLIEQAASVRVLVVSGAHTTAGRQGESWDAALVAVIQERIDRGPVYRTYIAATDALRILPLPAPLSASIVEVL